MLSREAIIDTIPHALETLEVPGGLPQGKVRDFYVLPDSKRRVLIATDRLTVFDHMIGLVPYKGQVLNELSAWWFNHTADIVPNHFLGTPDPNVMIVREARPILLAMIVRGYITGITPTSLWWRYAAGEREIYGFTFPDGLKKNEALPEPIVTPTTKATIGHEDRVPIRDAVNSGYIDVQTWDRARTIALALYRRGQTIAAEGGLILVDSKYEFGFDVETGELMLIDELHTPDSSRYWRVNTYEERLRAGREPEILDRELARLWYAAQQPNEPGSASQDLIIQTSQNYQRVYEMITGETFQPAPYPPHERIEAALAEYA